MHKEKGFTLLEIILVISALAILAGIVIIAIKPSQQLGDTRNAQRRSDVTNTLNALWQYSIDNDGNFPQAIDGATSTSQVLGTATSGCDSTCGSVTTAVACADVSQDLAPDYLSALPVDPQTGSASNTDYYVNVDANGRLTVGACDMEQSATFSVTR